MKALPDTNALSALWNGDERVLDDLGEAECVFMSIIVLGELFAGFRGGTRLKENRARLAGFLAKPTVRTLELSTETAEVYGQIKDALKKAGTPVPINDVWLSAQAIETGSVLITFDNHFGNVPGIRLWDL